jgi:hypothetical protein
MKLASFRLKSSGKATIGVWWAGGSEVTCWISTLPTRQFACLHDRILERGLTPWRPHGD